MTDFYKKNRKKIILVTFLFFLFFGGWWNIRYNLPKTVEVAVRLFLGPTFKSSSIDFRKNKIIIKDFILADDNEVIIDVPKVEILYSKESLKNLRIEEIIVADGIANITRRKNGDINIVAAFTGNSEKNEEVEEKVEQKQPYDPGVSIPIDKITIENMTTTYRDLGYRLPIEQTVYNTKGYLTFSKIKGINLHFIANNKYEIYDFSFSTEKEPYSMRIKLSDIDVKNELVQYGYDGEELSYSNGKLNMDLIIASSGLLGWIDFKNINVRYIDLNDDIKNVEGRVDFKKEGIFLNATGILFDKVEKFSLSYKDEELNVDFDLVDVQKSNLEKLSYLKDIDLPFEKLKVDNVKFNLNLKEELSININTFIKEVKMAGSELRNTEIKFRYDSKGIHLPKILTTFNLLNEEGTSIISEEVNGVFDYFNEKGKFKFSLKNLDKKEYIPNFNGEFNFEIFEKSVNFNLNSNIVDIQGKYLNDEKKILLEKSEEYFLNYDLSQKKIIDGKGKIKFSLFDNNFLIDYSVYNNKLNLKSFALMVNGTKELEIFGDIDIDSFSYNLRLEAESLYFKNLLGLKDGELNAKMSGYIQGVRDKFDGEIKIDSLSVKYRAKLEDLKGKLFFSKNEVLSLEFDGEIGSIGYNDYNLNGLYLVARLKNNIFEIKSLNNQFLDIFGNLNLDTKNIDISGNIRKLSLKKFGIENPEIRLDEVNAKINGKLDNLVGNLSLDDVKIILENKESIVIKGGLDYKNNKIRAKDLKINNNLFEGEYSLRNREYNSTIFLLEENIGRYYGNESFKYRIIGKALIKGKDKTVAVDLKSTIDKIYISGNRLPNAYIEAEYRAQNLTDGILKLNGLTLSNQNLETLLKINGDYDVSKKYLDTKISKQSLPLTKLKEYTRLEDLTGELIVEGRIKGELDKLAYNLGIKSNELGMKNVYLNSFKLILSGDLKNVNLDELSFKYLNNLFYSQGNYDILSKKYMYKGDAKDINLDFLNIFLEPYGITGIKGSSTFSFKLRENENTGFLKIKNFNLENKDLFLKLEQFNSTIKLKGKDLSVEEFQGKLNDGNINLVGNFVVPVIEEIEKNPYFKEDLKYNFNLKLNGIKYRYGEMFGVNFNSDIVVDNNKVLGNIEIIDGTVEEIPNTSKSIFDKIKEFIFRSSSQTVNESEDLGSDFKIETVFENSPEINVGIKIVKGIKLDIKDLNSFVGDVVGNVVGNGTLSGKDGKYTFLGNVEVMKGSLNVNDNIFTLDRAVVIFNDEKTYLPKLNPNLLIDARVNVQDDEIGLSLNGNLNNLKFNISSKSGSSSGNLNSLLVDGDMNEGNNEATTTLITNVIGGQLTQVLKPVSNLIKNTLNISKFRISSNLLNDQSKNANTNEEAQSRLRFGAVLEAEDNIYKDKIWWVAKGTLLEDDSTEYEKKNNESGALREYDFSLEYRFDATKSIGIGVGKLPEDRKKSSDKESKENLNYHIDFKFEKRYDSLIDIFINK